ncbi:methyltransferase domain-containing protein [Bacillus sp. FJAT-49736]|uniref:class I SAM-dependent methyltransferase n=1 Tax=Bacillus sp. FJAT-49736 TaxID=2833582 RepID=UPI001BC8DB07|nr:methyltransferase domain-containing protein [Bacillus sp. FJAT-49736]MBS4174497.1 methyltransferase domain-containing protein [Bacillus sp. FJAT-49736]
MAGHRFKPEKAAKLLDTNRKQLIPQEKVVELLSIEENDIVADLGAGNGYLTLPYAKETSQSLYAVDIEVKMLELLKERAAKEGIYNIQYIESNLEEIQLQDNSVDKAVVAFVMHEIPNMEKALGEFKRILKPGGRLLILDWEAVEAEVGPPIHERISSEDMRKFMIEKGYKSEVVPFNSDVYAITLDNK